VGQHTPLAAGSRQVQQRIDHLAATVEWLTPARFLREQRFNALPLLVGQVGWIGFSRFHAEKLYFVIFCWRGNVANFRHVQDDFIRKLPMHYRTVVGEGGTRLSVGERQRINLARAFLKNAPILLMDEPTSALDVESEAQVVQSLSELMRGRTTLMVAHRLTTIQRVNFILVLENGMLKESGSPEELMAGAGYYSRVVSGQTQLD